MASSFPTLTKDFYIPCGTTWRQEIEIDTEYYSFLGKEAEMQIKDINDYFENITLTSLGGNILLDGTSGLFTIVMSVENTDLLEKTCNYKLEFIENTGVTIIDRILKGKVIPELDD